MDSKKNRLKELALKNGLTKSHPSGSFAISVVSGSNVKIQKYENRKR